MRVKEDKRMNENFKKPITIIRAEFISNLTNLINESMLPPFIIEPILKDVYLDMKEISKKQYELDVIKYEQAKQNQLKTHSTSNTIN